MKKLIIPAAVCVLFASCVSMEKTYTGTIPVYETIKPEKKAGHKKEDAPKEKTAVFPSAREAADIMRVLLYEQKKIILESRGKIRAKGGGEIPSSGCFEITAENGRINVNGGFIDAKNILFSSRDPIKINSGKNYRGDIAVYLKDGLIKTINIVSMSEYLYGVLPSEISPKWPYEALRAQAVAARTFAVHRRVHNKTPEYDLDATAFSQVYKGFDIEHERTNKAVDDTKNEVLIHNGRVIQAFFHANSGGRTAAPEEVWGGRLEYMKSVDDEFSLGEKYGSWEHREKLYTIAVRLTNRGINTGELYNISPVDLTESGRIKTVKLYGGNGTFFLKGTLFRSYVGVNLLRSTKFTMEIEKDEVIFKGAGWGHGVGMSQEGAKIMAEKGFDYKKILNHYYPAARLAVVR
ncbi:MAG: SpoIID/LytB domain-containing protein [Candidatus Goldiibacteriota bacterium]